MTKRKGFTLLELTIALAIIAIASGGIFLVFRQSPRRDLENASLQLQADIRYAQRRAIIEGRRIEVRINRYHYVIRYVNPGGVFGEIRTVYFQNGVHIRQTNTNSIGFLPRGTVGGSGTLSLANARYEQNLTITVSGGRVEIKPITVRNR